MKSKEEILKMSEKELLDYKWSSALDAKTNDVIETSDSNNKDANTNCLECYDCMNCYDCFNCKNCSSCSNCSNCINCRYCRNLNNAKTGYWICNVEVTKEEFEKNIKEL
jgi:hypothetical protein